MFFVRGVARQETKETHMIKEGSFFKMSVIEIQLVYFRLDKRLFYADSPTTVKVREMSGLIDYYEDENKPISKILRKFFPRQRFLVISVYHTKCL